MTRISYRRATPENWELTIRRMMSLNNVQLTPDVARRIIKYSVRFARAGARRSAAGHVRRRAAADRLHLQPPTTEIHRSLQPCHSMGRVISERRTRGRMGRSHRDASVLLSGHRRRLRRIPPRRRRRRQAAPCGGWRRRQGAERRRAAARGGGGRRRTAADNRQPFDRRSGPSRGGVSADVAGMGRVVGRDADAAAGRPLGACRL